MAAHPPIEAYDELDSTSAEARRRAEAGDGGPVWITAAVQTAGRGRRGRAWSTQRGNLAAWATQGFPPIAAGWSERAPGLGQRCEARLPNRTLTGVAEGLDPDGALRLRLDDGGLERITAGDVFFGGA